MLGNQALIRKGIKNSQFIFPFFAVFIGILIIGWGVFDDSFGIGAFGALLAGGFLFYASKLKSSFVEVTATEIIWQRQFVGRKVLRLEDMESFKVEVIPTQSGDVKIVAFKLQHSKKSEHLPFDYKDMDAVVSILAQRVSKAN